MKTLKHFNKTITVEVSVDSIAQRLLETIKEDEKHKVNIVESIISPLLHSGKLTYIYNALNGYTNEINFVVGEFVKVDSKFYTYVDEHNKELVDQAYRQFTHGLEIVDIDIYQTNKVEIKYPYRIKDNVIEYKTNFINHNNCSKIPLPKKVGKIELDNDAL